MAKGFPTIVLCKSGIMDSARSSFSLLLEAETGEQFWVTFTLRGILSTALLAANWRPLREGIKLAWGKRKFFDGA